MHTTRIVTVALAGNPNTGKTTLFNALSGLNQRVGNYPGVTVEMKKGRAVHDGTPLELLDLPGTYSLAARSPDEMVAVDLLLGHRPEERRPDVILSIVDASNLDRHLYLTTQLLELGVPVVVALNMLDVAEAHGIRVDPETLAQQLGVPVVPIQANKKKGLDALKAALARAAAAGVAPTHTPEFPEAFDGEVRALGEAFDGERPEPFLLRRLLIDVGGDVERRYASRPGMSERLRAARERLQAARCPVPAVEARTRYAWIRRVTAECVTRPEIRPVTLTDRIDRVLTHRVGGTLVFLVVMLVVFLSIFLAAAPVMDLINTARDTLAAAVKDALPAGAFTDLLADGVIKGVGSVVVFLPQILILYGFIAVLEDCGYMARAAFLMDRLMSRCGLSGKSFIPLLSSAACAVPGIMATRVIENRRDRLATILVAPLMSCSARLPVYSVLIAAFFPEPWWVRGLMLFAMYMIGFVVAPLMALLLKRTLLRGETPLFVMEMPAYKWPALGTVLRRMADAGIAFILRAGTVILATMVVVWALLYFPNRMPDGRTYAKAIAEAKAASDDAVSHLVEAGRMGDEAAVRFAEEQKARFDAEARHLAGEWQRQSVLGQAGRALEPAFRPLGWDWKIGMAALASFPAREVIAGTLSIIYESDAEEAEEDDEKEQKLADSVRDAWSAEGAGLPGGPAAGVPRALSVMVFFALCCQCASTLAVIRRETGTWSWPLFTFAYMTTLAYIAALATFQVGLLFVGG